MLTSPNTPNGKHSEFEIRNSLFEAVRRRHSLDARCLMLSANFLGRAPEVHNIGQPRVLAVAETRG